MGRGGGGGGGLGVGWGGDPLVSRVSVLTVTRKTLSNPPWSVENFLDPHMTHMINQSIMFQTFDHLSYL